MNLCAEPELDAPGFRGLMDILRDAGVRISVGSDAHELPYMGRTALLDAFLQERGFSAAQRWTPARS